MPVASAPRGSRAGIAGWPPRWLTAVSAAERERGDGQMVGEFLEGYCLVTKDTLGGKTGDPLVLRAWQWELLRHLFARRTDGRRRHRVGLIGLPRKNGKSALGSGIALFGLLAEGQGAEVYSCAADKEQARIVFGVAKRMVELQPELAEVCKLYRDAIEVPETGGVYRVLSSEAFTKEGLSPTLVVYDELHAAPDDELWNVMNLGSAARLDPLVLAITTAGAVSDSKGQPTVCHRLYTHGCDVAAGHVEDPAFFFAWYEPRDVAADHRDPAVWAEANPGFGDLIDPEDFESAVKRTPEPEFRTKRTNLFVSALTAWLPFGAWDERAVARRLVDGETVVLGFDGSFSGDSTALVACTEDGYIEVVEAWEKTSGAEGWRVDIEAVEEAIAAACKRYSVREVACDPFRWQRTLQALEAKGIPVTEWPTNSAQRMVPATARFYDAVMEGRLSHDGSGALSRHIANCVIKTDRLGPRITKTHRMSERRIDLAVAAVIAYDRATQLAPVESPPNIW